VKVSVNGIPNKIYSQGIKPLDMWHEVVRRFGKYDANDHLTSDMDATKFYTEDKFALFIDLRSMRDQDMHGSGLMLVKTQDGVLLEINRKTSSVDEIVQCHIFIIADAQVSNMNNVLDSIMYS